MFFEISARHRNFLRQKRADVSVAPCSFCWRATNRHTTRTSRQLPFKVLDIHTHTHTQTHTHTHTRTHTHRQLPFKVPHPMHTSYTHAHTHMHTHTHTHTHTHEQTGKEQEGGARGANLIFNPPALIQPRHRDFLRHRSYSRSLVSYSRSLVSYSRSLLSYSRSLVS